MASIKEWLLGKLITSVTAGDYLRVVLSAGQSKILPFELLNVPMSQVEDLLSTLSGKASKETTEALKGFLAYIKADGDTAGSGMELKTITALNIDDLKNGIGFASTPFVISSVGTVYGAFAVGNIPIGENATGGTPTASVQLVLTSYGLFYRIFSVDWGKFSYVGGSNDVRSFTRDELISLIEDDGLTPGTQYLLNNHGGDSGIILTASMSNLFSREATRLTFVPSYYGTGSFAGKTWIGEWTSHLLDSDVSTGNYATYLGRVWSNKTGNIGTTSGFGLDSTNWGLVDYSDTDAYNVEAHSIIYDIRNDGVSTSGWISSESDSRGNTFGSNVDDLSGFRTEYNLFGNDNVYGNRLRSVRNCRTDGTHKIYNNSGGGDIYDMTLSNVSECSLPDSNNNIRHCTGSTIYKAFLGGMADIQYLATDSNISNSTINGDVKGDSMSYSKIVMSDTTVTYSGEVKDNVDVNILGSVIGGTIELNTAVELNNTYMHGQTQVSGNVDISIYASTLLPNAIMTSCDCNGFSYTECVINTTISGESLTADSTITMSKGKISASFVIGTGTFTIPSGGSFSLPSVVTGCVVTKGRENGIEIDTSDRVFVVKYSGYYRLFHNTSGTVSSAAIVEAQAFKNGSTPITEWYNKKKYSSTDSWQITSLPNYPVYLEAGDVISVRYRHDYGGTLTATLGQINRTLEYDN